MKTPPQVFSASRNKRFRLYLAIIFSVLTFAVSRFNFSYPISFMIAWLVFAVIYLSFSWYIILSFHPAQVKTSSKEEDLSATIIFIMVLSAAFISLFAIVMLLQSIPDLDKQGKNSHILLSIAAVFCSWLLINTIFTLRYAHMYYSDTNNRNDSTNAGTNALQFPNEEEPDYLDFAYFSFVLGMTYQVSDVTINTKNIRRLALLHGFLSFVYNTVIVALSINIVSGLISK